MKKALFVAFAATVALFATSCKKAEAPKASFTYDVEDLTVTFQNLSKNADTYAWDFGDGQTSTEANPVHTYAENGDYSVVLTAKGEGGEAQYSETVTLATALIKIDGEFADWDAAISKGQAVSTKLQEGVTYEMTSVKKFAALMDEECIYFMLAFDPTDVMPLDMYIGCSGERVDESPCTHYWDPMYCDYLVEFGKGDTFTEVEAEMDWYDWSYSTQFLFDKETGGWAFTQVSQNITTLSNRVVIDGVTYVEGKMARAAFQMTAAYIYISCNTSNEGWSGSGMAPAAPLDEESGSPVYQPQLKVEQAK